jgi:hypothetical protein
MTRLFTPSPLTGEGWGGGENDAHCSAASTLIHPFTPTLALPRQGGGNKRGHDHG